MNYEYIEVCKRADDIPNIFLFEQKYKKISINNFISGAIQLL